MAILNNAVLDEIKELVEKEVKRDINELKLEDAKVIVQVLMSEIDRIITSKFNKFARRLAADVISWDLIKETEETQVESKPKRKYTRKQKDNGGAIEQKQPLTNMVGTDKNQDDNRINPVNETRHEDLDQ